MKKPLFFSTFMYSACKELGAEWPKTLAYELANVTNPSHVSQWAGFRTLRQAAKLGPLHAYVGEQTYVTKARCVAAGHFLRAEGSDCDDVWLTCDDDVFASADVLARLVAGCRQTRGLVALPYLRRDGRGMTHHGLGDMTIDLGDAGPVRTVERVGQGLVAMHRDFIQRLADVEAPFYESDERPLLCPAIFLEGPVNGMWLGDDYWLCMLAERERLPMHVLLEAAGVHAGRMAMLDSRGHVVAP